VFAFGEGVALPTRLRFSELAADLIPRSESMSSVRIDAKRGVDTALIDRVVERWRSATMGNKHKLGETLEVAERHPGPATGTLASAHESERAILRAANASVATGSTSEGRAEPAKDGRERDLRAMLLRR
jgi:hypothetical protein